MRKRGLVAVLLIILSLPLAAAITREVSMGYLWSMDTNITSNPLVQYADVAFLELRAETPYIKRFNNDLHTEANFYPSNSARTGFSLSFDLAIPYSSTSYRPETLDGGPFHSYTDDWRYREYDSLDEQSLSLFFGIGPIFKARVLSSLIAVGGAMRLSLGSYDYFSNDIVLGFQVDPFVEININENTFITLGGHIDAHLLSLYLRNDKSIYRDDYMMMSVGSYLAIGYRIGGSNER